MGRRRHPREEIRERIRDNARSSWSGWSTSLVAIWCGARRSHPRASRSCVRIARLLDPCRGKAAPSRDRRGTQKEVGLVSGACVVVTVTSKPSGTAEEALARGWDERVDGPRPDVWSPASTSWTVLLQQHRAGRDATSIVPDRSPSLMQSPLVLAMPVTMAEALGWPDRPIGWSDLLELARDPRGWGALTSRVGHLMGKRSDDLDVGPAAPSPRRRTTGRPRPHRCGRHRSHVVRS